MQINLQVTIDAWQDATFNDVPGYSYEVSIVGSLAEPIQRQGTINQAGDLTSARSSYAELESQVMREVRQAFQQAMREARPS